MALSLRQILAIAFVLCVAALPVLFWLHAGYRPAPRPPGKETELLLKFRPNNDGTYRTQTFVFAKLKDDVPLVVYEDQVPLDVRTFSTTRLGEAREINFASSDGTDPNANGRRYWAVRP